jgi:hypothetical protein
MSTCARAKSLDRFAATGSGHRRLIDCLLCGISRGNRRVVMKTFLNIFRQLDEIDFRDSRFVFQDDAVRLHPSHGGILVFFPADQFEIVSERGCRETQNQKGENLHLLITREFLERSRCATQGFFSAAIQLRIAIGRNMMIVVIAATHLSEDNPDYECTYHE